MREVGWCAMSRISELWRLLCQRNCWNISRRDLGYYAVGGPSRVGEASVGPQGGLGVSGGVCGKGEGGGGRRRRPSSLQARGLV